MRVRQARKGRCRHSFPGGVTLALLASLFLAGCLADAPAPPPTDGASRAPTAHLAAAPTAGPLATPTPGASPTALDAAPTNTADPPTPTVVPTPSRTPIALPIASLAPFPTVTPDYVVYPTKPVFLFVGRVGGDGGNNTDVYFGRGTPTLIIYGDGQLLLREGTYGQSFAFREATLTPDEMCSLRQQLEGIGFTQPHDTFYTQREGSDGVGHLVVQMEDVFYMFYGPDVPYLVDDLAQGINLLQAYRPVQPLRPYMPASLLLWIEEAAPPASPTPPPWPLDRPGLADLWSPGEPNLVLVEGEWVEPIFNVFSRQLTQKVFQAGESAYAIIARPLLPHETPRRVSPIPGLPRDYVPVVRCDGEPALISPAVPTATPTLTAPAARLTGRGRIVFVIGQSSEQELYLMEADGSTRLHLTNNLFRDGQPAWSPDGRRIAFVSDRQGNLDIFVMNANGTNVVQLTSHPADDYAPTWSPDGERLAFVSDRDGGWQRSEIFAIGADGSAPERLTDNRSRDLWPVWSPDGRHIAFVQEQESQNTARLVVLRLGQPALVEAPTSVTAPGMPRPAWSPDGERLAVVVRTTQGETLIRLVGLDGTELLTLSVAPLEQPTSLDWSADGRFIVFAGRQTNIGEDARRFSEDSGYFSDLGIYALEIATAEVIRLTFTEQDEWSPALWP